MLMVIDEKKKARVNVKSTNANDKLLELIAKGTSSIRFDALNGRCEWCGIDKK